MTLALNCPRPACSLLYLRAHVRRDLSLIDRVPWVSLGERAWLVSDLSLSKRSSLSETLLDAVAPPQPDHSHAPRGDERSQCLRGWLVVEQPREPRLDARTGVWWMRLQWGSRESFNAWHWSLGMGEEWTGRPCLEPERVALLAAAALQARADSRKLPKDRRPPQLLLPASPSRRLLLFRAPQEL